MIIVRLMGGMGNQMFQYAFAKSLSIRNNTSLKIDLSLLGDQDEKNENHVVRHFDLDVFNLDSPFASKSEIELFNGKNNPNFFYRLKFKMNRIIGKYQLVIQNENKFDRMQLEDISNNSCIVGRWQSELFFKEYKLEIKRLLNFNSFIPNQYSVGISNKMKSSISVGLHVRRGDYVTNPIYSDGIGTLSIDYYEKARKIIKERISESDKIITHFFISDDIEWCKKAFSNWPNAIFVEQEKTKNGYVSDMWLLTLCDHVIISNSTFAWWGAYIGEKENSIVIAPEKWAKKDSFIPNCILPDRWFALNNSFDNEYLKSESI